MDESRALAATAATAPAGPSLDWPTVALALSGLLIGSLLIVTGHATTPEAGWFVSPVFAMAGMSARSRR
ncbi:hypothetical protein ACIP9H_40360 [Streptomyces sp. NPDC088732]|uniref:hypothetical protein n=1 Tax=Streptomyces sp. NPDC088732 TaxID=3365879 RepID=UPI003818865B